ncbi:unnamed protein product [Somion occarium]|uniref:choline-phosphate cytidylyltransferase n=1 Tax=Somion occarium TaxID=3059160 RepID=A0ABP1CQW8_9APHY
MEPAAKKQQHSKRSVPSNAKHLPHIHPHARLDSPAYDASEEDNDPLTDDGASAISIPVSRSRDKSSVSASIRSVLQGSRPGAQGRHALAAALVSSDEGVDSPTYDGDIESSTTAGPGQEAVSRASSSYAASIASTLSPTTPPSSLPNFKLGQRPTPAHPSIPTEPPPVMPIPMRSSGNPGFRLPSYPLDPLPTLLAPNTPNTFNPANLSPEDVQRHFREEIDGEGIAVGLGEDRKVYKINEPPKDRPVRIYADGVYDLFHFGHALQLRQAKLAFPNIIVPNSSNDSSSPLKTPPASSSSTSLLTPPATSTPSPNQTQFIPGVYLLVGVNSDLQCAQHKSRTVMTHAERCESVRHCRWVDEVVPDAPWVITEEFLQKYEIDYVAHDQDPYGSAGHDDVYAYCKTQGKFLPTLRTPGISTSDLLARLVSGYRHRIWDKKLEKMGMRDLMAEGSDWDESRVGSRGGSVGGESGAGSGQGSREESPEREAANGDSVGRTKTKTEQMEQLQS